MKIKVIDKYHKPICDLRTIQIEDRVLTQILTKQGRWVNISDNSFIFRCDGVSNFLKINDETVVVKKNNSAGSSVG